MKKLRNYILAAFTALALFFIPNAYAVHASQHMLPGILQHKNLVEVWPV